MTQLLTIHSSASGEKSVTEKIIKLIVEHLTSSSSKVDVFKRDLNQSEVPLLNPEMIGAFFSPDGQTTPEQKAQLEPSNLYVSEIKNADIIVIGAPMYNFAIPARLKAYFDLIARVGKTFEYTAEGPKGLLTHKRAIVAVATGGSPIGSPYDHVTPYLKQFLVFIGITDITFISLDQRGDTAKQLEDIKVDIQKLALS